MELREQQGADDIKWEMKKREGSHCKIGNEVNTEGGRETDNTNIV